MELVAFGWRLQQFGFTKFFELSIGVSVTDIALLNLVGDVQLSWSF